VESDWNPFAKEQQLSWKNRNNYQNINSTGTILATLFPPRSPSFSTFVQQIQSNNNNINRKNAIDRMAPFHRSSLSTPTTSLLPLRPYQSSLFPFSSSRVTQLSNRNYNTNTSSPFPIQPKTKKISIFHIGLLGISLLFGGLYFFTGSLLFASISLLALSLLLTFLIATWVLLLFFFLFALWLVPLLLGYGKGEAIHKRIMTELINDEELKSELGYPLVEDEELEQVNQADSNGIEYARTVKVTGPKGAVIVFYRVEKPWFGGEWEVTELTIKRTANTEKIRFT